jgi:hypothetical protein
MQAGTEAATCTAILMPARHHTMIITGQRLLVQQEWVYVILELPQCSDVWRATLLVESSATRLTSRQAK